MVDMIDYEQFWTDWESARNNKERWELLREFHEWTPGEYNLAKEEAERNNWSPHMFLPLPLYIEHQHPHVVFVEVDENDDNVEDDDNW